MHAEMWKVWQTSSGHFDWQVNSCEKNSHVALGLQMEKSTDSSRCNVFFQTFVVK